MNKRQQIIEVIPYDPSWSEQFELEAAFIKEIFSNNFSAIHHIGSTAVPGLVAKPTIDILLEVKDINQVDQYNPQMAALGYEAWGEYGIPGRRFFVKGEEFRTHHVHAFQFGSPDIPRHLYLRDYLKTHPEEAKAYANLKIKLAQEFTNNRRAYRLGKEAFVKALEQKAINWHKQQEPTMKRLLNKVAIITGGNSGIGKGIAKFFLEEGAKVVICGRNKETLAQAKAEMGNNILAIECDVTKTQELKNLYEQTLKHYGKCDILVVNSGVGKRKHVSDVEEEDFDRMVDINYRGAYFTVKYALDYLNPNASIIFIASVAATLTIKHHSVYASTKAAIVKLAKNLAFDLSDRGIRVNSISPGYIRTPIFEERLKTDPTYLARREAMIPLKRVGTPQDIANAALFLASEEASYITGVDLLVDGGYASAFHEPS